MSRFVYTNFCDSSDKQTWKSSYEQLQAAQKAYPRVEIVSDDILAADAEYESITGINPARFKGHTPPVVVQCLKP